MTKNVIQNKTDKNSNLCCNSHCCNRNYWGVLYSSTEYRSHIPATQEEQERYNTLGIAQRYVVTSPTFAFDGDINSLKTEYVGSTKSIPPQHIFRAIFESSHDGFGNREGQMLTRVMTPHTMEILVSEGNVISAITDKAWDEQKELFIQRETELEISDQVSEYDYASLTDAFEKEGITARG